MKKDPLVKEKEEKRPLDKGDGTKLNPVRIDEKEFAKEVTYAQLNGTLGLIVH